MSNISKILEDSTILTMAYW